MRNSAYAVVVLSSLILHAGCGDDGNSSAGETTQMPTMVNPTMTMTASATESGTDSVGNTDTDEPTVGMSDSQTSNGPNPSTSTDPTTGSSMTSTDPMTSSTGPDTMSDPSTDPGETSSTDPSGTGTTGPVDTTGQVDPSTTTGDDTTTTFPDDTEDVPCSIQMATLTPIPPNIMLVLDKSGSMLTLWDHDANANTPTITRWASLHSVVSNVVNTFDQQINFGANLFPSKQATNSYDATACTVQANVEVTVGVNKGTPIINAIPAANNMTIKGGTPSSAGMTAALNHLKATVDDTLPRAVLFITDGAANCTMGQMGTNLFEVYDMSLHDIVNTAFTVDNIPTYVIGIDISTQMTPNTMDGNPNGIIPSEKLNDVAVKGGKPKNDPNEKFYNASNQIELNAALQAIISDALSCEITLDSEPAKPEFTEVEIMGMEIPFVPTCNGMNGWTWVNPNGPYDALVLCGTACTQLKQVGEADVNFFCSPG